MTQLKESIILLTGANGGFGQAFTRQLLAAGSHLILTDKDETALKNHVETLQKEIQTGKILAYWGIDLSQAEGCRILYDLVKSLNLSPDMIINNAGLGLYGRIDEIPSDKWEQLMQLNLLTPMRLTALFLPEMIHRKKGHIVNISSLAGWITPRGITPYCSSKFGLRGFSEGLWQDVKDDNVKVTCVYPFFSKTPILNSEKYGTYAQTYQPIPDYFITDPSKVIQRTLKAIEKDKLQVFPDVYAQILSFFSRYFPLLINSILKR
jgi:short-subunit dehydrogenase